MHSLLYARRYRVLRQTDGVADRLLGLSAAVVKAAGKVWLKDRLFAAGASAEVVDVIKVRSLGTGSATR